MAICTKAAKIIERCLVFNTHFSNVYGMVMNFDAGIPDVAIDLRRIHLALLTE